MGIPYDQARCPTCNHELTRPPKRKTKCPHCSDYLYVKYHPGQDREERQIVGSNEAAQIEAEWDRQNRLEHDIRHAQYGLERATNVLSILNEELPDGLVMFYVQFVGPLRHGDVIEARNCHDKQVYLRVVDLHQDRIVSSDEWHGGLEQRASKELLIRPLIDGSTADFMDPMTGFVARGTIAIPDRWSMPWRIRR